MNVLVLALFFVSGISGLIYEVIWVRQFGTLFGSTVYSASLVAAIYMCGLGVGAWAAGRWADTRFRRDPTAPLAAYGAFELAIAALGLTAALGLPPLAELSSRVSSYVRAPNGWYELSLGSSLFRYGSALLLLVPITTLMGGTLTLLVRFVVASEVSAAGWRIGVLYAVNTAGAALGCLLTDTALVPLLGLLRSQLLAVALNVVAGVGAVALARRVRTRGSGTGPVLELPAAAPLGPLDRRAVALTGLAIALTGFAAMGMQVVWFRHLTSILGAYRPVFSALLTVILVGIWVGSALGGWAERRFRAPASLYALAQGLFVATTLAGLAWVGRDRILAAGEAWSGGPDDPEWVFRLGRYAATLRGAFLTLGLPALLMGVSFPLANARIQNVGAVVGRRAGFLYLANTIGGVLGALVAGFLLLPGVGAQRATVWLVGCAGLAIVPLQLAGGERARRVRFVGAYALAAGGLLAFGALPSDHLLRQTLPAWADPERVEVVTISEGVNENIAILRDRREPPLWTRLLTNGTSMSGTGAMARRYMHSFVHFPLLADERAEKAMVMCFGCGNTLAATLLHPSLREVHMVDLSRHVLEQARFYEGGDALRDERVSVFVNDGRDHLRMQPEESFDLITGEPPPIAYAGVVNLYTREFFELARSRLTTKGVVTYWLPIDQVSQPVARSIVRAFLDVFPDAVLLSGFREHLILVGAKQGAPTFDPRRAEARLRASAALRTDLRSTYLEDPVELVGTFVAGADDLRAATRGVAALRDDRPAMEYGSTVYTRYEGPPADFFTVAGVESWCPACFEGALSTEERQDLATYLDFMRAYYASERFRALDPTAELPLAPTPRLERVLQRSTYLRSLVAKVPLPYQQAMAWMRRGAPERALEPLRWVLQVEPANLPARVALADALLALGRRDEAVSELRTVLDRAPGWAVAERVLAAAEADSGR